MKPIWLLFDEEDLEWLDSMLRIEYNSYSNDIDGEVLKAEVIKRAARFKRTKLIEEWGILEKKLPN